MSTLRDRVRQLSDQSRNVHDTDKTLSQRVRYVASLDPVREHECDTEGEEVPLDPITYDPLRSGQYVSIYHTEAAVNGQEKPKCFNLDSILQWLSSGRSRYTSLPNPPITVNRVQTRNLLRSNRSGFMKFRSYDSGERNGPSHIYKLRSFIPHWVQDNPESTSYPYDMIQVNVPGRGNLRTNRFKLVRELQQVDDFETYVSTVLPGIRISNRRRRARNSPISSVDALSDRSRNRFRIVGSQVQ